MNYKQKKQRNSVWIENDLNIVTNNLNQKQGTFFQYSQQKKECLQYSIKKTKLCRLKASDRLDIYNNITNWIISLISLALIILPVLELTIGITGGYKYLENLLSFVEISLAIIILVFTQMIANYHYSVRALRFHQCAIELGALDKKLDFIYVDDQDKMSVDNFKQVYKEYDSILTKYENHATVDYDEYRIYHKLDNKCSENPSKGKNKDLKWLMYIKKYILGLFPQLLLLSIALSLIVYLFCKSSY